MSDRCREVCDVAEAIREIWSQSQDLNDCIPVTDGEDNRFFGEGYSLVSPSFPYAVLEQTQVLDPTSLGGQAVLDRRLFQLKIYDKSRQRLVDTSTEARRQLELTSGIATCQGQICRIRVGGGQLVMFASGVRMMLHNLTVFVTQTFE